jgi:hypothetical protein
MTLTEIKQAIEENKSVFWVNQAYQVIKNKFGDYLIKHTSGNCIGLTWRDGVTLNGKENEFFVE